MSPNLSNALALSFGLLALFTLLVWTVSLRLKNVAIVDICWGLGFVLVSWSTYIVSFPESRPAWVLLLLVTVWGVRLSTYLAWRNHGKPEDARYAAMREKSQQNFAIRSLYIVFGLQALLIWIISMPLQVGICEARPFDTWSYIGIVFWCVGVFFEAVGDWQLAQFKASPENLGKVMQSGLWKYTRHPNYFGDFMVWWGLFLVAATPGTWWWTILSPVIMTFLLLRVSGVRLLESGLSHRLDGYKEYVQRTSAFFPFPPKQTGR